MKTKSTTDHSRVYFPPDPARITEYVVEQDVGGYNFSTYWRAKWRYFRKEDAEWMAQYQTIIKGRTVRILKVETSRP